MGTLKINKAGIPVETESPLVDSTKNVYSEILKAAQIWRDARKREREVFNANRATIELCRIRDCLQEERIKERTEYLVRKRREKKG